MLKFDVFTHITLTIWISLCLFTTSNGEECTIVAEDCPGGQCLEKLNCNHGYCQKNGKCKCFPCYTGAYCDIYYDDNKPYMNLQLDEVFVTPSKNKEVIYEVTASDEDFDISCNSYNVMCPCSDFSFVMRNQSNEFILDSRGNLRIREGVTLMSGKIYTLTLSLIGKHSNFGQAFDTVYDQMTLTVRCLGDNEYPPSKTSILGSREHKRTKRNTNVMEATISDVALIMDPDYPNPESLRPGMAVRFLVDITLAKITTDIKITISTRDPISETSNLALWGVKVDSIGSKILGGGGIPAPLAPSDFPATLTNVVGNTLFVDIADIDFGSLTNDDTYSDTGPFDDSRITLSFFATMTDNTDYTPVDITSIYVGVQYGAGIFVWVAKASLQYATPAMEFGQKFTLSGPDTVPQYQGAFIEISSYIAKPFAVVHIEASFIDNTHDKLSIENIRVVRKGANTKMFPFPILQPVYRKSVTDRTNFLTKLSFTSLLALDGIVDENLVIGDEKYEYKIQLVAFVGDAVVGENVGIFFSVRIEESSTTWADVQYITVAAEEDVLVKYPTMQLVEMSGSLPNLRPHESEVYALNFGLTYNNNPLECAITPTVATDRVAGVMWGESGIYVSRFPNLREAVTYGDDGSAMWSVDVNLSVTETTHQVDGDQTFAQILISISSPTAAPSVVNVLCNDDNPMTIPAATLNEVASSVAIDGDSSLPQDDNKWYPGSTIAFSSNVNFKGTAYPDITYQSIMEMNGNNFAVEVCKVEILGVGTGIGSILKSVSQLESLTTYTNTLDTVYNNTVEVNLGSIGASKITDSKASDYGVEFRVYYDLPLGQVESIVAGDYKVVAGLHIDTKAIWVSDAAVTVVDGIPPDVVADRPVLAGAVSESSKNALGLAQLVIASVKTNPGAITANKLIVTANTGTVICRIHILTVGRNLGCLDKDFFGKENDPKQKIKAAYDPTDRTSKVTLDLGVNRNFGGKVNDLYMSNNLDEDSIEIGVFVRGKEETTTSFSVNLQLQTGPDDSAFISPVTLVTLDTGGVFVSSTDADLVLTTPADITAYAEVMTTINFTITVPVDYTRKVVIAAKTDTAKLIAPCYLALVKTGQNVPCAIQSSTNKAVFEATDTGAILTLDIGKICYYPMQPGDSTESVVDLRLGVKLLKGATNGDVTISLLEDDTEKATSTVTVTNGGVYVPEENVTLYQYSMRGPDTPTYLTSGTLANVSAFITMPPYTTLPMKIGVFTDSKDGRAIATVHAVRAGKIMGKNVGCLDEGNMPVSLLAQNYSGIDQIPLIHISQTNVLLTDVAYITNTGVTYIRGDRVAEDDEFELEVEILVADHDSLADGDIFHVYFGIMYDMEVIFINMLNLTMIRTGTETPVITSNIYLLDETTTLYEAKTPIGFGLTLAHDIGTSQREIYDAIVRVCLPESISYVMDTDAEYTESVASLVGTFESNITATLTKSICLDFNIDYLFFTDILKLTISVAVDPYDILPNGLASINGAAVLRLLGREGSLTEPKIYPIPAKYVEFKYGSTDIFDDLKIESFLPCQFTASSAVNEAMGPENAASLSEIGWIPATFATPIPTHNIRIDILRIARLTKVELVSVKDWSLPTSFRMKKSMDGVLYKSVCKTVITLDLDKLPTECRFQARFVMIEFDSIVDPYSTLGLKIKLFGKYMDENVAACPSPMTSTFYSSSSEGTNIVYDNFHKILYLCYHAYMKGGSKCYSTKDGNTFTVIYPITSLAGYDNNLEMVFGYVGTDNTLIASADGSTWKVVSDVKTPVEFPFPALQITAYPSALFLPIVLDDGWEVNFSGITKGGVLKIKSEG